MSCSIGQLNQIAPGFDDLMAELNKEVKKGGQRGGAPLGVCTTNISVTIFN